MSGYTRPPVVPDWTARPVVESPNQLVLDAAIDPVLVADRRNRMLPMWPENNPVGTERLRLPNEPSVGVATDIDPVVGYWPTGKPMLLSEYQGIEDTGQNLFDRLSMMSPSGAQGTRMAAQVRRGGSVRAPRGPRPRGPRGAPEAVEAVEAVEAPEVTPGIGHNQGPPTAPEPAPTPALSEAGDVGGGTRGLMGLPSLRSMTPAQAAAAVASDPHIIPKPGGGYYGFPEHVRTPADIQAIRDNLDAAVDAGAHQRDWYLHERRWISDITGNHYDPNTGAILTGQPGQARRGAEGLAVFSPQSTPDTNLQFYLQARNAYERGEPLTVARTGEQARKYNTAMDETEEMAQGRKTDPFAQHLSADRPVGTTGVNDTWHARALGYRNPDGTPFSGSITEQMHIVMDHETVRAIERANARRAGGFTDWDAGRVQAAPWVAGKEAGLRVRYPNWSDERVRDTAREGFSNTAPNKTAYAVHEQAPGASTGLKVPPNQLGPFTEAATWRDETGRDALTGPLFHQSPMLETQGTYRNSRGELETNPSQTARPLVDFTAKKEPREIHPGTQAALTGTTAVRGLEDLQEGSSWHYIDTRDARPLGERTSMRLTGARPNAEQLDRLQTIADKHGYFLSDTGDGVSLIHNADSKAAPANGIELRNRLRDGLQGEIETALPGTQVATGRHSGDYVDLTNELALSVAGQGQATTKVLGLLEKMRTAAPKMYETTLDNPAVATKAQQNLDRLTPEMRATRPDYVELLQIMSAGKLRGLLDRVARRGAGGLPAALLAMSLGEEDDR